MCIILTYLKLFRKAEVDDFVSSIMRHDVFGLQVSMDDVVAVQDLNQRDQYHQTINDVLQNHPSLSLGNSSLCINLCLESTTIAIFDDENLQVFILVNVKTLEEIGTVTLVHKSRLRFSKSQLNLLYDLIFLCLHFAEIEHFDCNLFFALVIHAAVDTAIRTDANEVVDYILVDDQALDGESPLFVFFISQE